MNLTELNKLFRQRTDDLSPPYLWADTDVTAFFNEAVAEAVFRARLIYDESSVVTTIDVVYEQAVYTIDKSIYEIVDAWIVSNNPQYPNNGRVLIGTSQSTLDSQNELTMRRSMFNSFYQYYTNSYLYYLGGNWRQWKGLPRYYIQDQSRFQLVPIPTTLSPLYTEQVNLGVYRIPIESEWMKAGSDEPVIPAQWHHRLIDWALYRAYSKFDADAFDKERAALALATFEQSFGPRPDANMIRKQQARTRRTVQCAWP